MCDTVIIASEKQLPIVSWDSAAPGFYTSEVKEENLLGMIREIISCDFYYEVLSFMGCSCGLCFYASYINDPEEEYDQRVLDVRRFADYLDQHKVDNSLRLFNFNWEEFLDEYPKRNFSTQEMKGSEFSLQDLTILNVV